MDELYAVGWRAPSGAAALAAPRPVAGGLSPGAGLLQTGLGAAPLTGTAFALNRETRSGGVISFWSKGEKGTPILYVEWRQRRTARLQSASGSGHRASYCCSTTPSPVDGVIQTLVPPDSRADHTLPVVGQDPS